MAAIQHMDERDAAAVIAAAGIINFNNTET